MRVEIYHMLDEKLQNSWQTLWERSSYSHSFNSPQWFLACEEAFGYTKSLILVAYKASRVVGILPLVLAHKYGIKVYCSPGYSYLDKSSLLLESNDLSILVNLIKKLLTTGDFYLTEIEEVLIKDIPKYIPKLGITNSSLCPYLPMNDDIYRFISTRNKNKILRKIESERGNLEYKLSLGNVENNLKIMSKIESESPKVADYKDILSDPSVKKLYTLFDKIQGGNFLVNTLFYKGEPIGYRYGFIYDGTFHECNTAYKTLYRSMTPGKVLAYLMLPSLVQMGIKKVDFSRGNTEFKREFTPYIYQQCSIYYSSNKLVMLMWKTLNYFLNYLEKHPKLFEALRKGKKMSSKFLTAVTFSIQKHF